MVSKKRKLIYYLFVVVLMLAMLPGINTLASVITDADYVATIRITNNSTAPASEVSVPFTLDTANLITTGFTNQTLSTSAVRTNAATDTEYMPANSGNNTWVLQVPTISYNTQLDYRLYLGGSTDMEGVRRYFPGASGANITDAASIEPSGNFTISMQGRLDASVSGNLSGKADSFRLYGDGSGNVTFSTGNFTSSNITQSQRDGIISLYSALRTRVAQRINNFPVGVVISANFTLGRVGNAIGIAYARVRGVTNDNLLGVLGSIDVSTITADNSSYVFNTGYAIIPTSQDVRICIEYESGDSGNFIQAGQQTTDVIPGGFQSLYDGSWTDDGTNDLTFEVLTGEANLLTANGLTSAEQIISTSIGDAPDFDTFASDAKMAVNMGAGLIPIVILERKELVTDSATVSFTGIDTLVSKYNSITGETARHLVLIPQLASDHASTSRDFNFLINSDTATNYNREEFAGFSSSSSGLIQTDVRSYTPFRQPGQNVGADAYGGGEIFIINAFSSTAQKPILTRGGAADRHAVFTAGRWDNAAAVNSITFRPDTASFTADSVFIIAVVDERYLIEEVEPTGASVTISSLGSTGNSIFVIGEARTDRAGFATDGIKREFNADTTASNYYYQRVVALGGATSASNVNNSNIATVTAADAGAGEFGAFIEIISQYAETGNNTFSLSQSGYHESSGAASAQVELYASSWNNTDAVTQIKYSPLNGTGFVSGSRFSVYSVPRTVISRVILTTEVPTVTFAGIPAGYQSIALNILARSDFAATDDEVAITINNDGTAANYDRQKIRGRAAVLAISQSNATQNWVNIPGASATASLFGGGTLTMNQYSNTNKEKHGIGIMGTGTDEIQFISTRWENTDAITSFSLNPEGANFLPGSIFELIGVMPTNTLSISVDGEVKAITDATADNVTLTIPDTANDFNFFDNFVMPYVETANVTVGGNVVGSWVWNNGSVLTDLSGNSNDMIPVYRTTTSNANVTAELVSFRAITNATASNWTLSSFGTMVSEFPDEPTDMYSELDTAHIPGNQFVVDVLGASTTPVALFWFTIPFALMVIAGILVFKASRSLFAQWGVMMVILIAFASMGPIPYWTAFIFAINGIGLMVASKSFGW